jgi:hypothetical protein
MRKIFLFAVALCSSASLLAAEQLIDGINYELNDDELKATVTAKDPVYTGDIVIPATVDYDAKTYNVVRIGSNAFQDCTEVTSVSLPDGLEEIGFDAFWNCSMLTSITIPSTVTTIESYAFEYTGLTSFTLPNTVTSLGTYVFAGCTGLTEPIYNDKIFAYIPRDYSGTYIVPDGITTINGTAFQNTTNLTGVTLPSSLLVIEGGGAFLSSAITSIVIPNSVTIIDESAFKSSALATITLGTGLTRIGGGCFESTNLTSVTVPEGVTDILSRAFADCSSLTTINLPSTLSYLASDAFAGCPLEHISVADGNAMFDTRNDCNALIYSEEDKLVLGCENSTIPEGVKIIGSQAFAGKMITSVTIPSTVTTIEWGAFENCSALTSCNLPNSVVKIEDYAFREIGLTTPLYNDKFFVFQPRNTEGEVTIPDGIVHITSTALADCEKITKINFPTSLKSVGVDVFWNIDSIRSIELPEGVDSLGMYIFDYCEKLETITLPSTLRYLDGYTFYHCDSLKTIICYAETPVIDGGHNLYESDVTEQSSVTLYVPDGSVAAYQAAEGWSGFTIKAISSIPTAIDNTAADVKAIKTLRNGQLLIERDGKIYNALGVQVK